MGYSEHPQRYIIDMRRYSKQESWQWPANIDIAHKRKLLFDLHVNVQHVDYLNVLQDEEGFIPIKYSKVDKMMFYPAFLRSFTSARSLRPSTLVAFATAVSVLVLGWS